jgi:hypothetical protein
MRGPVGSRLNGKAVAMLVMLPGLGACGAPTLRAGPCDALDPSLSASAFVLVSSPAPGQSASSPLRVRGCSRSFESNIVWSLRGRDGRRLASGHASGGGVDGPAAFDFTVEFAVREPEVGELEVLEPDVSDGEGNPPSRMVFPVILQPAGQSPDEGAPAAMLGDFLDDYDISYSITPDAWAQGETARYEIVEWDRDGQSVLARNALTNPTDGGLWTRIDWVMLEPAESEYAWAYCYTVYDAPSPEAAREAPATGRDTPRSGCNGFPFSRMKAVRTP